ncbi:polysaccharide export protein [Moritella marina ATCC 15381]|uniref:Polysaccharide export protein n=1 Tax=Moritella marina ATCC 15381 TaxID=1202962 RepID=A0A5J6WL25_MORMI|nr:polysaccharide biosynthesis/export family protein [Moritella marina]QFI37495.1 polysaccharide export protein [Moritella marina ATCC 15381]
MLKKIAISLLFVFIQFSALAKGSYILGPGDKVEIKVFGQEDLTVETLLSNSGQINYPFFGEIKVTGLTVKQVEKLIYKGLKGNYLINPNVYVHVVEHRPFYIHGEVKKPGGYPYQPGLTVNQAIALAGGLTERASKEKIYLFKEKNKKSQINASMTYRVNAGDTILIKQRFF